MRALGRNGARTLLARLEQRHDDPEVREKCEHDAAEDHGMTRAELLRLAELSDVEVTRRALRIVHHKLGLDPECELLRVVETNAEEPSLRIETSTGVVRLGSGTRWQLRADEFRAKFRAGTRHGVSNKLKGEAWEKVCLMILNAAEVEDVGDEATAEGLALSWLGEFRLDREVVAVDDWEPGYGSLIDAGDGLHVVASALRKWLAHRGERPSNARLGEVLRAGGCTPARLDLVRGGERHQLRTWRVPSLHKPRAQ